jgi:hypothetical protein
MPDVIAKGDREKAAALIARWLEGNVTNWDFEDEWPEQSDDRAVVDIGRALWRLYSDFPQRPLNASNLSANELAVLRKCLAFMQSGESYEPVPYEEAVPWKPNLLTRLFGVKERPWETMRLKIDAERQKWWPFADEAQWRDVAK